MFLQDFGTQQGVLSVNALHFDGTQLSLFLSAHDAPTAGAPGDMQPPPDPKVVKLMDFAHMQAIVQAPVYTPMAGAPGDLPYPPDPKVTK
jgi:hypothetical protein